MNLIKLQDLPISGKRVIIRFDGDVPVENGKIQDDYRLKGVLPTIKWCREHHADVVLLAHRGRPKGKVVPELSNEVLVDYLHTALGEPVTFVKDFKQATRNHPVVLYENVRFFPGEESNDPKFAKQIAALGDVYCNDAFASWQAHTSVADVARLLPHCAGIKLQEEIENLSCLLGDMDRPYCVVMGGAKAKEKSPIIADLIPRVNSFVIGGLIAITYLAAQNKPTGAHPIDKDEVAEACECIKRMQAANIKFVLPVDAITQNREIKRFTDFTPQDLMIDIGPESQKLFASVINQANTLFWNGAMGKFEDPAFAGGTIAVGRAIAANDADVKVAAGGDTVSAIHDAKLEQGFSFISTGGGAALKFIAGRELPGIAVLENK